MKSNVVYDKLNDDKLKLFLLILKTLRDVVDNDVKKTVYSELGNAIHTSYLVKKADYNTTMNEIENKVNDYDDDKYITTQELNK